MTREIFYTATLVRPDGSDSFDGGPCERGCGATVETGWLDPDWTLWEVHENREDVRPDTWTPDDGDPVAWMLERISERLGMVDNVSGTGEHVSIYAAEEQRDFRTGVSIMPAAHPKGFTEQEIERATAALGVK